MVSCAPKTSSTIVGAPEAGLIRRASRIPSSPDEPQSLWIHYDITEANYSGLSTPKHLPSTTTTGRPVVSPINPQCGTRIWRCRRHCSIGICAFGQDTLPTKPSQGVHPHISSRWIYTSCGPLPAFAARGPRGRLQSRVCMSSTHAPLAPPRRDTRRPLQHRGQTWRGRLLCDRRRRLAPYRRCPSGQARYSETGSHKLRWCIPPLSRRGPVKVEGPFPKVCLLNSLGKFNLCFAPKSTDSHSNLSCHCRILT